MPAEGRHDYFLKIIGHLLGAPLAPFRYANNSGGGGSFSLDGAPGMTNLQEDVIDVVNVCGALTGELQWAGGGIYWVTPVDFRNAFQSVSGMGGSFGAMVQQINLEPVGRAHGAGFRPPSINLRADLPLDGLSGNGLADEGEVLDGSPGLIDLIA